MNNRFRGPQQKPVGPKVKGPHYVPNQLIAASDRVYVTLENGSVRRLTPKRLADPVGWVKERAQPAPPAGDGGEK